MNMEVASTNSIFRPLLTWNKDEISQFARKIGTFEYSKIDSACRTIAPESPSTELKASKLERMKDEIGFESLVEGLVSSIELKKM
jgi:thiamine biosynthesis protein ThiI